MIFKSGPQKISNDHVKAFPNLRSLRGHWVDLTVTALGAKATVKTHDWNLCTKCNQGRVRP